MRRIHRHWSQQQIEFAFAIIGDESSCLGIQFMQPKLTNAIFRK